MGSMAFSPQREIDPCITAIDLPYELFVIRAASEAKLLVGLRVFPRRKLHTRRNRAVLQNGKPHAGQDFEEGTMKYAAIAVVAMLCLSGCNRDAVRAGGYDREKTSGLSSSDREFLEKAAKGSDG